ncbi:hypothetical protein [Amycolatopsis palatopharyngis]|uniref:hypothetical protein n=1 Tax=Amycolatopsis palatopharyngis TaxID=187982 RepID=UPI000E25C909|nr:hypothetical protein [Amycolatopsis palatopharyngis]
MPLPSLGRLSSRSGPKAESQGRHRNAAPTEAEEAAEDHELTSYLAALAPDSDDPESTGSGRRFGEAQVFQLRLNLIASQQLKDIAAARDTSPQALAQEWILERLSWEGQASAQLRQFEEQHTEEHFFDQQWPQPVDNRH